MVAGFLPPTAPHHARWLAGGRAHSARSAQPRPAHAGIHRDLDQLDDVRLLRVDQPGGRSRPRLLHQSPGLRGDGNRDPARAAARTPVDGGCGRRRGRPHHRHRRGRGAMDRHHSGAEFRQLRPAQEAGGCGCRDRAHRGDAHPLSRGGTRPGLLRGAGQRGRDEQRMGHGRAPRPPRARDRDPPHVVRRRSKPAAPGHSRRVAILHAHRDLHPGHHGLRGCRQHGRVDWFHPHLGRPGDLLHRRDTAIPPSEPSGCP